MIRGDATVRVVAVLTSVMVLSSAASWSSETRAGETHPAVTESDKTLRAGAARRVITPDPFLPITGGMGPTEPAHGKRGELTVRALVLASGETRVALVTVDTLGFPAVLGDRARAKIPNIPADHILISATHTHSAPDTYAFPDGRGGHTGNLDYMQLVCDRIAEAVNEAYAKAQAAELRVATGKAEGRIAYNYYAPDLYDRRVHVLQLRRPSGSTIATLVNYAVHPEVLGADEGLISPDLVGPLTNRLESEMGGMALFINGAQGGMVTADNRNLDRPRDATRGYWHDRSTWQECVRIGEQLAAESQRFINAAPWQTAPKLAIATRHVTFPVESDDMWNVVVHSPLNYPHNDDRSVTTRVSYVRLGNARILTIPGEALPNIGFYLKRKMPGEHPFLFGLTNDAFGYILTKVDFDSFERYDYISAVSLGEMTGEIYIRQALQLAREMESAR